MSGAGAESECGAAAKSVIAELQQKVQAWMDGDQLLPADGSALLAALERGLAALCSEDAPAARAGIEAFVGRVEALIEERVLAVEDSLPLIETSTGILALLESTGKTGG